MCLFIEDLRILSFACKQTVRGAGGGVVVICSRSSFAAVSPISNVGCYMLVRGGSTS